MPRSGRGNEFSLTVFALVPLSHPSIPINQVRRVYAAVLCRIPNGKEVFAQCGNLTTPVDEATLVRTIRSLRIDRRGTGPGPIEATVPPSVVGSCPDRYVRPEVESLAFLRSVQHVSGVVVVTQCPALKRLDGGLARLDTVAGIYEGASITISDNAQLTGGLVAMLPGMSMRHAFGSVTNNPKLCTGTAADWLMEWSGLGASGGNANFGQCGCLEPGAANFRLVRNSSVDDGMIDDGSCVFPSCPGCAPGTAGACSYTLGSSTICMPLTGGVCPTVPLPVSVTFCDICKDVVCIEPPKVRKQKEKRRKEKRRAN
jgi:hypothetical protein